jgi:hypothetical protein
MTDGAGRDMASIDRREPMVRLAADPGSGLWLHWHRYDTLTDLGTGSELQHPIGPGTLDVAFEPDGRMWVLNGELATYDGETWTVYRNPLGADPVGGLDWKAPRYVTTLPSGGVVTAWATNDHTEFHHHDLATPGRNRPFAEPLPRPNGPLGIGGLAATADGWVWVIEWRLVEDGDRWTREPSRLLRSSGGPWEEVYPLGGARPDPLAGLRGSGDEPMSVLQRHLTGGTLEPVAMVLDPSGDLVVHLREYGAAGMRLENPFDPSSYGGGEWVVRQAQGDTWEPLAGSDTGLPEGAHLLGASEDTLWLAKPRVDERCQGVLEVNPDTNRSRSILPHLCANDVVVAADGRAWLVGSRGFTSDDATVPEVYAISPDPATGSS